MTYQFPESLHPLRNYLRSRGFDGDAIKTSRQAAFVAQQLLGSRIKFPPQGSDMTSTLLLIQKQIPATKQVANLATCPTDPFGKAHNLPHSQVTKATNGKGKKVKTSNHKPEKPVYLKAFSPEAIATGLHVFADGACVPNPGPGGWGIAVYRDGQEIASDCGGEAESTNNRMEITAVLRAVQWAKQYPTIKVTIWSDSQYTVNGVNDWRHGWKAKGWQRGGPDAKPENRILLNSELWQELDAALEDSRAGNISVNWVKGHAGHAGNERADELAEIGRLQFFGISEELPDLLDLDREYAQIMGGYHRSIMAG